MSNIGELNATIIRQQEKIKELENKIVGLEALLEDKDERIADLNNLIREDYEDAVEYNVKIASYRELIHNLSVLIDNSHVFDEHQDDDVV